MNSEAIPYLPRIMAGNLGARQKNVRESSVIPELNESPPQIVDPIESFGLLVDFSDEILLETTQTGNRDALTILFRRYARLVRVVANRILRNEAEADDLVQEVFLFIFRRADLFDAARGNARSWIVQVTYHRAIDRRRYLASRHFYNGEPLSDRVLCNTSSGHYEESIEGKLGRVALREIEQSLSEDQRHVLKLYFYEDFALSEIAEAMGQTVGNIRNHYYRGLEKMRRHIFEAKSRAR